MKRFFVFSGLLALFPVTSFAASCDLQIVENSSAGNQKRARIFVFTDAKEPNEQMAVAKGAAEDFITKTGYDFVDVMLQLDGATRERNDLSGYSGPVWLQYAPIPAKIPFMDGPWVLKAATGKPYNDGGVPNYIHDIKLRDGEVVKIQALACDLPANKIKKGLRK